MKYFIIICSVIIVFMIWVLIPRKKKGDDSETDYHPADDDSPVPHTHTDSCTKFIQKIKVKKKKDDPNKNDDDFPPYQPPCGTCSGCSGG